MKGFACTWKRRTGGQRRRRRSGEQKLENRFLIKLTAVKHAYLIKYCKFVRKNLVKKSIFFQCLTAISQWPYFYTPQCTKHHTLYNTTTETTTQIITSFAKAEKKKKASPTEMFRDVYHEMPTHLNKQLDEVVVEL